VGVKRFYCITQGKKSTEPVHQGRLTYTFRPEDGKVIFYRFKEMKRNRTPGNRDWVIIKLATAGIIEKAIIDTAHFKGNYPDRFSLDGCQSPTDDDVLNGKVEWQPLLPEQNLQPDTEHDFDGDELKPVTVSHVRLNIFPDGGISRLRLFGKKMS
jgi:allantoicase